MNDKVFLDTNILVYAHTDMDAVKQSTAQGLISSHNNTFISSQVFQELANTLNKKFKLHWPEVQNVLSDAKTNNNLFINSDATILKACELAQRYKFSFYDSLIIAAALECNCTTLYSEDLHNSQIIDGKLKIVNPFV